MEVKGVNAGSSAYRPSPRIVTGLDTDKLAQCRESLGNLVAALGSDDQETSLPAAEDFGLRDEGEAAQADDIVPVPVDVRDV